VLIREGRRAVQQLSALTTDVSKSGSSNKETASRSTAMTTLSTVLEQDFTVEGKKGKLECPFSTARRSSERGGTQLAQDFLDTTPHRSSDPICAAMFEETTSQPAAVSGAAQCPIRFLDQHSPEGIANYVEKHKHEIPRSHEVCVRRYQKNEEQIRKLDAKYGNLVSMITDLSQLHKPMLPSTSNQGAEEELDRASNERVENWAQEVSANVAEDMSHVDLSDEVDNEHTRESHFDRPLNEVRVGESPSRPWGISIPVYDDTGLRVDNEPPAPPLASPRQAMDLPDLAPDESPKAALGGPAKCPFDHTKFMVRQEVPASPTQEMEAESSHRTSAEAVVEDPFSPPPPRAPSYQKQEQPYSNPQQPAFINPGASKTGQTNAPQMLFTGPVFIGYPIEQAIQFMQHFQSR